MHVFVSVCVCSCVDQSTQTQVVHCQEGGAQQEEVRFPPAGEERVAGGEHGGQHTNVATDEAVVQRQRGHHLSLSLSLLIMKEDAHAHIYSNVHAYILACMFTPRNLVLACMQALWSTCSAAGVGCCLSVCGLVG